MDGAWQDLRFGLRTLAKSPGFTSVVVLTLALGIGANTAIFSYVDAVLMKPLPYRDPDQLVMLWEQRPDGGRNGISTLNFLDWKNHSTAFQSMAAVTGDGRTLTGVAEPVRLRTARVSASYFDVFGTRAVLGRTFAAREDQPGNDRVVVLSHRIWEARFGADRGILGRAINLDGEPYIVVGVLPAAAAYDRGWPDIWIPLAFKSAERTRDFHWLRAFGRLKSGFSVEKASAEMKSIAAAIARDYPESNKGWSVITDRFADRVVPSGLRKSLLVLMSAVAMVLLIGCVNVANLLLARAASREREVAIRSSLGARPARLVRQFLTESLLLSLCGALLGLAIAYGLIAALRAALPPFALPAEASVSIDGRVLAFTMAVTLTTAVLFGIAPALSAARKNVVSALKEGGRGASAGAAPARLRGVLVTVEMALAFVLLAGAGLLIRSFFALQNVDPGFESTNVVTMGLSVSSKRVTDPDRLAAYQREVMAEVQALPGVRSVALTSALPLQGWGYGMPYQIAGRPEVDRANRRGGFFKMVTPSYFSALGIRLRQGRFLSVLDRKGAAPAAVINETFAKRDFPGEDPIGRRVLVQEIIPGRPELGPEIAWEIVGVIADEKIGGLDDRESAGMYVPLWQSPNYNTSLVIRTELDPQRSLKAIEDRVHRLDPNQALTDVRTMEQIKSESVATTRLRTILLAVFASFAVLLSAVGVYGVISYSVVSRTHELGIRSALGASVSHLVRLVIKSGMTMSLIGLAIGLGGAFGATRLLASLLFDVTPNDIPTLAGVAAVLVLVALLACYVPARRATRVDPMEALRCE
jgi:putative ABC transport system permease protein